MRQITFIFLILSCYAYSQEKSVYEMIKSYDAEKDRQAQAQKRSARISLQSALEHEQKLGVDPIADNNNEYTFRLSFFNTFITLYRYNGEEFGNVVMFAHNADEDTEGHTFKMTYSIHKDKVEQMLQVIDNAKAVDTIPSDAFIKAWKQGFDGIVYNLQQKRDSTYTFKRYWSPHYFKELLQAMLVKHFTDEFLEIAEYKSLNHDFHKRIPFNMYSIGTNYTVMKAVLTTKEYKKKKREARRRKRRMKQ